MASLKKRYAKALCSSVIPFALFLAVLTPLSSSDGGETRISGYKAVFRALRSPDGAVSIATREFYLDGGKTYLALNPETFETSIVKAGKTEKWMEEGPESAAVMGTPFIKALSRYTSPPVSLQNHGIRRSEQEAGGFFLSVDLCPSKKALDRDLFTSVGSLKGPGDRPQHLNIAVSGGWILKHRDEFEWLLKEEKAGNISVTWINHSYSHPYDSKAPVGENFLLSPGVDFEKEVLLNEVLLLENGVLPSPFFRFPGLVQDEGLVNKLKTLSLIPVGANAWLAKGETPEDGSIILVHGNGNEREGIGAMLDLLDKLGEAMREGRMRLLPIKEAFLGAP